ENPNGNPAMRRGNEPHGFMQKRKFVALGALVAAPVVLTIGSAGDPVPELPPVRYEYIAAVGYDQDGEEVAEFYDFHPNSAYDLFTTGPGDVNGDGLVDLADLNLVLAHMGNEYR
ncbi:MAG: hypothetical protein ACIAQF_11105, partial [Phycisphaerales bacterium JB065]